MEKKAGHLLGPAKTTQKDIRDGGATGGRRQTKRSTKKLKMSLGKVGTWYCRRKRKAKGVTDTLEKKNSVTVTQIPHRV